MISEKSLGKVVVQNQDKNKIDLTYGIKSPQQIKGNHNKVIKRIYIQRNSFTLTVLHPD